MTKPHTSSQYIGIAAAALFAALGMTQAASAGHSGAPAATWAEEHPRRDEVNDRIENQEARISKDLSEGKITPSQATTLRAEDKTIRGEEQSMAKTDGGHITKADQKSLNQQLNYNSKQIKTDAGK